MSQSDNVPVRQCPGRTMSRSDNVQVKQCPGQKMSQLENVLVGKVATQSENVPPQKENVQQMSLVNIQSANVEWENVSKPHHHKRVSERVPAVAVPTFACQSAALCRRKMGHSFGFSWAGWVFHIFHELIIFTFTKLSFMYLV